MPSLFPGGNMDAMALAQPIRSLAGVVENLPGIVAAFRRYCDAYKRVKPALEAPGGMAATLRMMPELASNLDKWLADQGATPMIGVRGALFRSALSAHVWAMTAPSDLNGARAAPPRLLRKA
jgi:hypothetical protein